MVENWSKGNMQNLTGNKLIKKQGQLLIRDFFNIGYIFQNGTDRIKPAASYGALAPPVDRRVIQVL
jgi:hypothetical protein